MFPHRSAGPQVIQGRFLQGYPQFRAPGVAQASRRGNVFVVPQAIKLSAPGHGQVLPPTVQAKMESVFEADFSDVRIHVGPQAQQIGAQAFTMGSHIYFAPGQYNPTSHHGQRLLGHELAHVVQQRSGRVRNPFGNGVAVVQDPGLEAEADRMAMRAGQAPLRRPAFSGHLHSSGSAPAKTPGQQVQASPLAPHVQATLGMVQPKTPTTAPGGRSLAPHVQAAVVQPKGATPPSSSAPVVPETRGLPQVIQGKFPGGFSQVERFHQTAGTIQPYTTGPAIQLPPALATIHPRGRGRPLLAQVQRTMEAFFRADFSDVRVHVGPQAQQIGAQAFTLGNDLYFAPGQYNPHSAHGRRVIGHELAHVVQQRAGRVQNPFGSGVAIVQEPFLEAEADRLGRQAAAFQNQITLQRAQPLTPVSRDGALQRKRDTQPAAPASSRSRDHPHASRTPGTVETGPAWPAGTQLPRVAPTPQQAARPGVVQREEGSGQKPGDCVPCGPLPVVKPGSFPFPMADMQVIGSVPVTFEAYPMPVVLTSGFGGDALSSFFETETTSVPRNLGSLFSSTGYASHGWAGGEHLLKNESFMRQVGKSGTTSVSSWGSNKGAAKRIFTRNYWSSLAPRRGMVTLDRLVDQLPDDLTPRLAEELATTSPSKLTWTKNQFTVNEGFTHGSPKIKVQFTLEQLEEVASLVRQYNIDPTSIKPEKLRLLQQMAALHSSSGMTTGSPLVSFTKPNVSLDTITPRRYRVRVQVPRASVLNLSGPNSFNELGQLTQLTNKLEEEFLATLDNRGQKIVSVETIAKGSHGKPTFLMRHSNKIRWGGRVLLVAGFATSGYRIYNTPADMRHRVWGQEIGGQALGWAGSALAVAGCIFFGITTGGFGLFLCGLIGGMVGGGLGSYSGDFIADQFFSIR